MHSQRQGLALWVLVRQVAMYDCMTPDKHQLDATSTQINSNMTLRVCVQQQGRETEQVWSSKSASRRTERRKQETMYTGGELRGWVVRCETCSYREIAATVK